MACRRLVLLCLIIFSSDFALADVTIRIDGTPTRQTIEGFGATTMSLVFEGPLGDTLLPELRRQAVEAAYGQVKLNGGNLNVNFVPPAHDAAGGAEPAGLYHGYRTFGSEAMKTKLVNLAGPLGFTEWCLTAIPTARSSACAPREAHSSTAAGCWERPNSSFAPKAASAARSA